MNKIKIILQDPFITIQVYVVIARNNVPHLVYLILITRNSLMGNFFQFYYVSVSTND